jgi:hypothetical protein
MNPCRHRFPPSIPRLTGSSPPNRWRGKLPGGLYTPAQIDRICASREPLTDLVTVYLGMGVFTANAAFSFRQFTGTGTQGWRAQRLGYLTEQMLGYTLACYAMLRGEPDPRWAKYLDTNPRVYMKRGVRYLRHAAPGGSIPGTAATAAPG